MALDCDVSFDVEFPEIETTEQSTKTSTLSEEHVTILIQHIKYHAEMKQIIEKAVLKGQT